MDLTSAKVGDVLQMVPGSGLQGEVTPVVVSRVGRVWLYVTRVGGSYELSTAFRRADGKSDSTTGYPPRLTTPEKYAEGLEHGRRVKELREAGIQLTTHTDRRLTTDQLNRLLAIVSETA